MTWERRPLGSFTKTTKGKKPSMETFEYQEGLTRTIQIQDLRDDSKIKYTSDKSGVFINTQDIGIAWDGANAGTVGTGLTGFIGSTIARITFDTKEVDSRYLMHFLQTKFTYLNKSTTGSTIPHVNKSSLASLEIPLPPLPTQQRIAAVLDEVDALRQKRDRSINSLEALRESAYIFHLSENQASSTRVRVSELIDPHRGGMRTGPFGSQLLHSEFVDDPGGIMVLGIDNAVKNRFRYTGERFITPEKYEGLRRYTVHPGDVLVTIMGTCGRAAIVPSDIPTAINTKHLCAMTLNERCLPEYLHATLTYNHSVLKQMGASARGAIMDGLNMGIISGLEFDLPDILNQRKLQQVFAEIDSLNNKALHARGIEDALLSSIQTRAFSGELALRDLEALL